MNRGANPLIVSLFFLARCVVPLLVMLAVSYVLKRLGLLPEPPAPPGEAPSSPNGHDTNDNGGGVAHGAA